MWATIANHSPLGCFWQGVPMRFKGLPQQSIHCVGAHLLGQRATRPRGAKLRIQFRCHALDTACRVLAPLHGQHPFQFLARQLHDEAVFLGEPNAGDEQADAVRGVLDVVAVLAHELLALLAHVPEPHARCHLLQLGVGVTPERYEHPTRQEDFPVREEQVPRGVMLKYSTGSSQRYVLTLELPCAHRKTYFASSWTTMSNDSPCVWNASSECR